nr:MAG TPA: hypothetical protein [Caudoviricetes sp.]
MKLEIEYNFPKSPHPLTVLSEGEKVRRTYRNNNYKKCWIKSQHDNI